MFSVRDCQSIGHISKCCGSESRQKIIKTTMISDERRIQLQNQNSVIQRKSERKKEDSKQQQLKKSRAVQEAPISETVEKYKQVIDNVYAMKFTILRIPL